MSSLAVNLKFSRPSFALDVRAEIPGEGITVLVGPSGSGKTTLMRLIAGFEKADEGSIRLGQRTWLDCGKKINVPVRKRNVGIVFQDYALFPNMTVAQNIGYGVKRNKRAESVAAWIKRLELAGLEDRLPAQLSGGQRQRVALARTLAADPDLLLLDEPFSAVDAHLRQQLRAQLIALVAAFRKSVILVTHDLEEARQVGDLIGVMTAGRLARFGAAQDIFNDPGEYEVATVLGWRNLLPLTAGGQASGAGPEAGSEAASQQRSAAGPWGRLRVDGIPASAGWLAIRAEHIGLGQGPFAECALQARAMRCRELGAVRELQCCLPDNTLLHIHRPWNVPLPAPGETFMVHFPVQHLRVLGEGISLAGRRLTCRAPESLDQGPDQEFDQEFDQEPDQDTTHVGDFDVPSAGPL